VDGLPQFFGASQVGHSLKAGVGVAIGSYADALGGSVQVWRVAPEGLSLAEHSIGADSGTGDDG
jgi:hypothetical protein